MEPENQPPPSPQDVPIPIPDGPPNLPPAAESQRPKSRKGRRTLVVAGLILSLLLVGGGAAAFVLMRGSGELLLSKIPASADVVVVAYLDPSAGQKVNLLRIESRFPATGASQQVGQKASRALDMVLHGVGLDHTDASWVGPEVAVTVDFNASGPPATGILLATSDESAARASLQKLRGAPAAQLLKWSTEEHGGIQVSIGTSSIPGSSVSFAIVDGVVVIGNDKRVVEGVIDSAQGKVPALDGSTDFQRTMADLPTGRLGFAYVNPVSMLGLLEQSPAFQAAAAGSGIGDLKAVKGIGVTLSAEPGGLAIDKSIRYDSAQLSPQTRALLSAPPHANPLLKMVPAGAYGVFTQEHLDLTLKSLIDRLQASGQGQGAALAGPGLSDLLAVLSGDVAIEARSGSSGPFGGALLLGTKDEAGMQSSLDSLAAFIPGVGGGGSWKTELYKGVTIRYLQVAGGSGAGRTPAFAVIKGAGVVASSVDELHAIVDVSKGDADIASAPGFASATGTVPQRGSLLYLDVQRMVGDILATLPADARAAFDRGPGQNLKPIQSITWGSGGDAGHQRSRLFIQIP
jgi:hypothetical protein